MTQDDQLRQLGEAVRHFSDETIVFRAAVSSRLDLGLANRTAMSLLEARGPMTAGEMAPDRPDAPLGHGHAAAAGRWLGRARRRRRRCAARRDRAGPWRPRLARGRLRRHPAASGGIRRRLAAIYAAMSEDEFARTLALPTSLAEATAAARADLPDEPQIG